MKIITFASTKGGVGKSTTAALVADSLFRSGQTVQLIDFDNQASVTNWAIPVCARNEGIDIIDFDIPHEATVAECYNMMLDRLQDDVDWVIIDTKGGEDAKQMAALAICDRVFSPCGPEKNEVTGVEKTLAYFKIALEATGDGDTDPKDLLTVIYQKEGQFPNAQMLAYEELIHGHYGAIKGLHRSSAIKSFIGDDMTSDEAIAAAEADGRSFEAIKKIQRAADALAALITGEF
jgi:cellulose biosynthesis protein BcsQ